ncbi:MAG TPA: response regulator [Actinomycetota bacterium]|nr:response regulator [Actinomycetota bacterium]
MTRKILIVDDNPDIIGLLRASLRAAGYQTVEAMNGKIALRRVEEGRPDLILLDLMMPVLDGWGVLDALGRQPDPPPVVVITAAESPANEERARGLGVAGYVTKPFDVGALLDLVESVVGPPASGAGAAGSARAV